MRGRRVIDAGRRPTAGQGARRTPAQIGAAIAGTATHWYDARSNASGASWTPRNSGAPYAAVQAAPTSQPTLTTVGTQGHPALLFDGTNDFLQSVTPWALGDDAPCTIIAYGVASAGGSRAIMGSYLASAPATTMVSLGQASGRAYFFHRGDNWPTDLLTNAIGVTFTAGRVSQLYQQGAAIGAPVAHIAVAAGTDTSVIGSAPGVNGFYAGALAHLLIYQGVVLSAGQIAAVHSYLTGICS